MTDSAGFSPIRSVPDSWYVVPRPSGGCAAALSGGPKPNIRATASIVASINPISSLSRALRTTVTVARGIPYSSLSAGIGKLTLFCGFGSISPTARIATSTCPGAVCEKIWM